MLRIYDIYVSVDCVYVICWLVRVSHGYIYYLYMCVYSCILCVLFNLYTQNQYRRYNRKIKNFTRQGVGTSNFPMEIRVGCGWPRGSPIDAFVVRKPRYQIYSVYTIYHINYTYSMYIYTHLYTLKSTGR